MKKIKVGLIGFGLSGKYFHYPLVNHHPGYQVKIIYSSKANEIGQLNKEICVTQNIDELLNSDDIDLVINCAPNESHFTYAKKALENEKHVVIEKPFTNNSDEARELINLAKNKNKCLTVFHNRRWDSDFLTIKKLIRENKFGEIKNFESHFDRWRPHVDQHKWREKSLAGSGILFDLGSHLIDQALCLFGMPKQLWADILNQKTSSQVDDYFHLVLFYEKMRVILHSTSFSSLAPRFKIESDQGVFLKHHLDPQESYLKNHFPSYSNDFGIESLENFGSFHRFEPPRINIIDSERGDYFQFYELLYEKIAHNKGAVPVCPNEALKVIELIELAILSSKDGRRIEILS